MFEEKILEVYKKCELYEFPIDCEYILECYGYRTRSYSEISSQSRETMALIKRFSDDSFADRVNKLVLFNDKVNACRMRFSLMHELGHIVLEHVGETSEQEEEANIFASVMLAPRPMIYFRDLRTSDEIHDYFGISYTAANHIVKEMKNWLPNRFYNEFIYHIQTPSSTYLLKKEMIKIITALQKNSPGLVLEEVKSYV